VIADDKQWSTRWGGAFLWCCIGKKGKKKKAKWSKLVDATVNPKAGNIGIQKAATVPPTIGAETVGAPSLEGKEKIKKPGGEKA